MSGATPLNIAITLVHGTLAPNAPWTRDGSLLRTHLSRQLNWVVDFDVFQWSGWPFVLSRTPAAEQLRARLAGRLAALPEAKHFIIAHSHGGNIALYTLRDRLIADRITGVVTLSTPFLVTRVSKVSGPGYASRSGLLASPVASAPRVFLQSAE